MRDELDTILVVDDEERLADLFGTWLEDAYEVRTAYDGQSALDQLDDSVSVVLLDRRMPGLSGDEVLDRIRERGIDCRVIMVTAVDPDFDIIEMGFDDYIVKPIARDELLDIIEQVTTRAKYDTELQEYFSLVSKKALLEAEKSDRELDENDEYRKLTDRVDTLRRQVDDLREGVLEKHEDFVGAFERFDEAI
ncbi:MAG: HalX domain-containing protein [Halobacteriota archaeon]